MHLYANCLLREVIIMKKDFWWINHQMVTLVFPARYLDHIGSLAAIVVLSPLWVTFVHGNPGCFLKTSIIQWMNLELVSGNRRMGWITSLGFPPTHLRQNSAPDPPKKVSSGPLAHCLTPWKHHPGSFLVPLWKLLLPLCWCVCLLLGFTLHSPVSMSPPYRWDMCHNLHIKEKEQKLNWIGVLINIRFTLKENKELDQRFF